MTDHQGSVVAGATVRLRADYAGREVQIPEAQSHEVQTDDHGHFSFAAIDAGEYTLTAECSGFSGITRAVEVPENAAQTVDIQFSGIASQNESVSVSADVSGAGLFAPDPAQRILIRDETLDANPGRPGVPVSYVTASFTYHFARR